MSNSAPPKQIADLFLTDDERSHPVWHSIHAHLERMLAAKRIENDNPNLTDVETATLRGHLSCLKAFIALGKKPPQMTAPAARLGPRPDLGKRYG